MKKSEIIKKLNSVKNSGSKFEFTQMIHYFEFNRYVLAISYEAISKIEETDHVLRLITNNSEVTIWKNVTEHHIFIGG